MSYLHVYSAFRFLIVYKEQKIYSVFSVNLDIGPHTTSVTCKISENTGGRGFESRPHHTKGVKMVPVATLLGALHYKASTGFSSPSKYRTTNIATLTEIKKSEKVR